YLQSTHASTHQQYKMEIEHIFKIERENEDKMFNDVGNKMLLWHGSRLTNIAGIMSQGLRIAPPEAPVVSKISLEREPFGKPISIILMIRRRFSRKNVDIQILKLL
ncbi:unnamed protein product, partial [Rotaria magnacalcarata]